MDSEGVMLPLGVLLPVMLALAVRLGEDEAVPLDVCRGEAGPRAETDGWQEKQGRDPT
jgi:hypothetical protein